MPELSYDLTKFTTKDLTACALELRALGELIQQEDSLSMESISMRIAQTLRQQLSFGPQAEPAMALIRVFKTHNFDELPAELQKIAASADSNVTAGTACLTLLGTAGVNPRWNNRRHSRGHQVIPLRDEESVRRIPMIASLLEGFGLDIQQVLQRDPLFLESFESSTFNVFFVKEALGSEWIPAQEDFVAPMRIKSVLGLGGLLPKGDVFAIVMFSRVPITQDTATIFRSLSLTIRMLLSPYTGRVFAQEP